MQEPSSTSQNLARVEFATAMRGYDKDEVDTFLSELAEEHNRLVLDLAAAKRSAEKAHTELGEEIGDLLQHAKDVSDQLIKKAEEQAAELKEKTRRAADRALAEAERRAAELRRGAEAEAVNRIREAQSKVRALQETEREIRAHLHALKNTIGSLTQQIEEVQVTPTIEQPILDDAGEVRALESAAPSPSPA